VVDRAALAAMTERIELMVAVRPTFHLPALLPNRRRTSITSAAAADAERGVVLVGGRSAKYGVSFEQHDDRYARTGEWLEVLNGCVAGPFFVF